MEDGSVGDGWRGVEWKMEVSETDGEEWNGSVGDGWVGIESAGVHDRERDGLAPAAAFDDEDYMVTRTSGAALLLEIGDDL